ncbi:MAG: SBBP repeat-containing protein [Bryobacteraceae bacterium]|jgi:hypothetical protein
MSASFRVCSLVVLFTGLVRAVFGGDGGGINAAAYGKMPLMFELRGLESEQWFVAHISRRTVAFASSGEVIGSHQTDVPLRFVGARPNVRPQAEGPQAGIANYIRGSRPEYWRTSVPLFTAIKYADLYPGVDLTYYGNQNRLEYDLVVAPHASWRSIHLAFGGAKNVEIDREGSLRVQTGSGWVTHRRPVVYQSVQGSRREIFGQYVFNGWHEVGFDLGAYDPSRPLIIDPMLAFSGYLGGNGDDYGHAVAVDGSGCAYVVGETGSTDFPTLGPEQESMAGDTDVFITKWNAAGTGLVYSTYVGGSSRDVGLGVAVDAAGDAYVTGFTYSGDFPITPGALRTSFVGDSKAFVLELNAGGSGLIYATFLGGSGDDYGAGIAVDAAGEAHIAGYTASVDFPTTTGAFQQYYGGGSYDGFLAKLNAAGSALIYATYLGGIENDTAAGVALDPAGNIYVTGQTQSANFPTVNPLQAAGSESNAFVVKISASGPVQYATYLGGTGLNNGTAIAADAAGNAYVTGFTNAPDFPVTSNAYQPVNNGSYNAFVATLNAYGSSILNATYLGGSGPDSSYAIALDGSGDIFIAGSTNSINFPVNAAVQPAYGGGGDGFIAAFSNQLDSLEYATYFGGSGNDVAAGIAADSAGNAYVTGWTGSGGSSLGIPTTPGVFQPSSGGGIDAFFAKFSFASAAPISSPLPGITLSDNLADFSWDAVSGATEYQLIVGTTQGGANVFSGSTAGTSQTVGSIPCAAVPSGSIYVQLAAEVNGAWQPAADYTYKCKLGLGDFNGDGYQDVIWQNNSTHQVTVQYYDGAQGVTDIGWNWLNSSGAPTGWVMVGAADFDGNGVPDLVWEYMPTGQVTVQYYGGVGGATNIGWNWLYESGAVGWTVVAVADMNGDGVPDLIWQSNTTNQVSVHYYGGAEGAVDQGWNWLNSAGAPVGWRVVAAADFDENGTPDLIWEYMPTGQVTVQYYGGPGGATNIGWNWLNNAGVPGWTVAGANDFNGDGVPDLVWQDNATAQVTVHYYGGTGGATDIGWSWLNASGSPGWTAVVPR